jgi:hypothetical protein
LGNKVGFFLKTNLHNCQIEHFFFKYSIQTQISDSLKFNI